MKNDTLLRALALEPTDHTPIWLMRQAGRYLPEYNAARAKAGSFLALAKSPALATEVTLQPLERFALDAAILFSDILTIPDAMGLGLQFAEGEGPRFERPLRDERAIGALAVPDPGAELGYVLDAVRQIRRTLADRVPLIGFAGSPFTLACYMIEGGASDDWRTVKTMRHARPDLLHRVLAINAQAVAAYLQAQIAAGVHVAMIFDTWGGMLAYEDYVPASAPSASTGRATRAQRASSRRDASRCKAISIRPRSSHPRRRCARPRAACSMRSVRSRATSSTSATASRRRHRRRPSLHS